jgi:chromosome partitioning protein
MPVIAVFNQKGGVGKTTSVINLASQLTELNKTVLCLDIDPQGNTTSGLGVNKNGLEVTIYDLLVFIASLKPNTSDEIKKRNINEAIIQTDFKNVSVIPANKMLADAELNLGSKLNRETILKRIIDVIKDDFNYILIDCPPALGFLSINSLVAADKVIIPVSPGLFANEGMVEIQETIELIKDSLNPTLDVMGVLVTMFDIRENISKDMRKLLQEVFEDKVFKTSIRIDSKVKYAQENKQPINYYNKWCNASVDYMNLAKEVVNR